jgi:hypothetical protein
MAEQVLQRHYKTQLWVDLTLGMTKLQREEHIQQQAIQAAAQAKANGLNRSYKFEDTHSINLVKGRTDDGMAFTKTRNISLGETAYDVVLQSNESDLDDIFNKPYSNDKGSNGVNFNMDEFHRQLGQTIPRKQTSLSASTSKSSATSDQKEGQDVEMGNNDEVPGSVGGSGDKVRHTVLTQEPIKTSLQTTEASPSKDQALIPYGSEGLDPGGRMRFATERRHSAHEVRRATRYRSGGVSNSRNRIGTLTPTEKLQYEEIIAGIGYNTSQGKIKQQRRLNRGKNNDSNNTEEGSDNNDKANPEIERQEHQ